MEYAWWGQAHRYGVHRVRHGLAHRRAHPPLAAGCVAPALEFEAAHLHRRQTRGPSADGDINRDVRSDTGLLVRDEQEEALLDSQMPVVTEFHPTVVLAWAFGTVKQPPSRTARYICFAEQVRHTLRGRSELCAAALRRAVVVLVVEMVAVMVVVWGGRREVRVVPGLHPSWRSQKDLHSPVCHPASIPNKARLRTPLSHARPILFVVGRQRSRP